MHHHRRDIDGLRAIAILPVVAFHAGVGGFSGGYVGVDVFFVISGFVIASLIDRELSDGTFTLAGFYERRIRRLYPALFATLAVTAALAAMLLVPTDYAAFSKSALAAVGFVSNLWFWKHSGYFEADVDLVPLLHTWSLAVEEQFYIVMPLVLLVVHRWLGRRFVPVVLAGLVLSLALSVLATTRAPSANFFLLPTRAWELLLGALLALAPLRLTGRPWLADAAGTLGLALIAYAVVAYTDDTPFPGLAALVPCVGAALVILAGSDSRVGRLLSIRPLVAIGLISYSLYLVHWPLIVFQRYVTTRDPTAVEIAGLIAASLVLAALSWRYVEQPFPRARPGVPRRRAFVGAGAAMAAGVAVAAVGILGNGLPQRMPGFAAETIAMHDGWRSGTCFLLPETPVAGWRAEDCLRTKGNGPEILLWGDSYAAHWTPGLEANGPRLHADILQYTMAGCPPILAFRMNTRPYCSEFSARALDIVRERAITTVVLAGYWKAVRNRGLDRLPETIAALHDAGVRDVYVIGQSPVFATNVQTLAYRVGFTSEDVAAAWPHTVDAALSDAVRTASAGAIYVDPIPLLCGDGPCPIKADGRFLFSDDGHHSAFGSNRAVALAFPLVTPGDVATASDPASRPPVN